MGKLRPVGWVHHYKGHFKTLLRLFLEPSAWEGWPSFITIQGGYSWHQGKDMCGLGWREPSVGLCSLSPGEGEFFPVGLSLALGIPPDLPTPTQLYGQRQTTTVQTPTQLRDPVSLNPAQGASGSSSPSKNS